MRTSFAVAAVVAATLLASSAAAGTPSMRGAAKSMDVPAPAPRTGVRPAHGSPEAKRMLSVFPNSLSLEYPVEGRAATGKYEEYYVSSSSLEWPMTIQVTSQTGDADLYVSCGNYWSATYPSTSSNKWNSNNWDPLDEVSVTQQEWSSQHCDGQDMTIAVLGYMNSTFVIEAHGGNGAEELFDGEPMYDSLQVHTYKYFSFNHIGGDITVTVETWAGDCDLFVSCMSDPKPDMSNHKWGSMNAGSDDDVIRIQGTDAQYCTDGFQISVYAYDGAYVTDDNFFSDSAGSYSGWSDDTSSQDASFMITAVSGNHPMPFYLNYPEVGYVYNQEYSYLSLDAYYADPSGTKFIVATQTATGDADLYMSCSNNDLPTVNTHNRAAMATGDTPDVVVYTPRDSDICAPPGSYILGVYGYQETEFSVVAKPVDSSLSGGYFSEVDIPAGTRVGGSITRVGIVDEYLYYVVGNERTLTITVEDADSNYDADVYVRGLHNETDQNIIPTYANAEYQTSVTKRTTQTITIDMTKGAAHDAWGFKFVVESRAGGMPKYFVTVGDGLSVAERRLSPAQMPGADEDSIKRHKRMLKRQAASKANAAKYGKLKPRVLSVQPKKAQA